LIFTQGAALGWYVAALSGLRKTISDFMRSVFYSPAIGIDSDRLEEIDRVY